MSEAALDRDAHSPAVRAAFSAFRAAMRKAKTDFDKLAAVEDCAALIEPYDDDDAKDDLSNMGIACDLDPDRVTAALGAGYERAREAREYRDGREELPPIKKFNSTGIVQDALGRLEEKVAAADAAPRDKTTPKCFKPIALDDIAIDEDPVYLIEGVLPIGPALHIMYGPPKSFKSFGLMHAYLHIAAGLEYAGRMVLQGAVAYVTNEGIRGVTRRLVAMRRDLSIEGRGVPFYLIRVMPDLGSNSGDAEKLIAAIAAEVPPGIALRAIAIDTVRRAMPGKDENSAKDMSVLIANCGMIAERFNCLTSGVHHSPRSDDGRSAGSNSLDGAMDCGWSTIRDGNQATITNKIMKDGEEGDSWTFSLHPMEIGTTKAGLPIIGCSVNIDRNPSIEAINKQKPATRAPKAAPIALRALREAIDKLGAIPPASNYIPTNTKVVSIEQWRLYAYRMGISTGEERARQKAFKTGTEYLISTRAVVVWDEQAWIA